jgi:hypothetical protein
VAPRFGAGPQLAITVGRATQRGLVEEDEEDEEPGSDRIEVRPSDGDCNCWPIITVAGHFQLW